MNVSLLRKEILPLLLLFGSLIAATALADLALHLLDLVWVGRYLGIPGTILILMSFAYSMRKRKLIQVGRPKSLLRLHEFMTWSGALMILVHAGVHVYSILPWLALIALLVNVASGMVGQYLLERSRRHVAGRRDAYAERGLAGEAVDREIFWDAVTLDMMKQWRTVHFPISMAFAVLGLAHILSIFLYWQWK